MQEAEKRHGKMLDVCSEVELQSEHQQVLRVLARLGSRSRRLPKEHVGEGRLAQRADYLGRAAQGWSRDQEAQGVQIGIGMSQEIDSNMAGRALLWSFGGSIQDENEKVVINSPETVAAVEFMTQLYKESMTPEVFSWNAASNNQGLVAGQMSYILNSISAWRTAQTRTQRWPTTSPSSRR